MATTQHSKEICSGWFLECLGTAPPEQLGRAGSQGPNTWLPAIQPSPFTEDRPPSLTPGAPGPPGARPSSAHGWQEAQAGPPQPLLSSGSLFMPPSYPSLGPGTRMPPWASSDLLKNDKVRVYRWERGEAWTGEPTGHQPAPSWYLCVSVSDALSPPYTITSASEWPPVSFSRPSRMQ